MGRKDSKANEVTADEVPPPSSEGTPTQPPPDAPEELTPEMAELLEGAPLPGAGLSQAEALAEAKRLLEDADRKKEFEKRVAEEVVRRQRERDELAAKLSIQIQMATEARMRAEAEQAERRRLAYEDAMRSGEPEPVIWYRVRHATKVAIDGSLVSLPAGSMVCALTHDLDHLRSSGAMLDESEPPKRPVDSYGEGR